MNRTVCRELLAEARPQWVAGHGDVAWDRLERAELVAGEDPALQVEAMATRAGLHLLAEQPTPALVHARKAIAAWQALTNGGTAAELLDHETHLALADARVTVATLAPDETSGYSAPGTKAGGGSEGRGLAVLDEVAHDPSLGGSVPAARAASNALLLRIEQLWPRLATTSGQVEAWMHVSAALALVRPWPNQGTVLRQAVDLGMATGQWERAWAAVQEQLAASPYRPDRRGTGQARSSEPMAPGGPRSADRNELVSVLAKGALLAWDRGMATEARDLGERARSLSVAVDHPWVRTYAYLGGVIAAADTTSVGRALTAYTSCTTKAGHATRPHRAWTAARIALETGHPVGKVTAFLEATLPGVLADHLSVPALIQLADARDEDLDQELLARLSRHSLDVPTRARVALAVARWHTRHGRLTAAALDLEEARLLLRDYPGRLLQALEGQASALHKPVVATPAQRRVLGHLAEGSTNAQIADALELSERTVAVHVASLLKANDVSSRTALAVRHLRAELLTDAG